MDDQKLITRENADGLIEWVNPSTGQVVMIEKTKLKGKDGRRLKQRTRKQRLTRAENAKRKTHKVFDGNGNLVEVPLGTDPSTLPREIWPYNQVTAQLVLAKIMEGMSLAKIGKLEGFPPAHTLWYWTREYDEFKSEYLEAKKARAEWAHDQVLAQAEVVDESNYQSARTKIDAYKWVAKVNDRHTFGDTTKLVGDAANPIAILVDTGITRPGDEEREVKAEVMDG